MRSVVLTDSVDPSVLLAAPGVYAARSDTPAFGVLEGLLVSGQVRELGSVTTPDGVHMVAVQVGPTQNPAITIGAEFFQGAKADYSHWQEKWWREAIQNAVDAGATEIFCNVDRQDDRVRVVCQDNGKGMDEETLLNKFLVLGRSGKGSEPGSVGGFGKAKELLLLPWMAWTVLTKRDGAEGVEVTGHGIQYDVAQGARGRGTTIIVDMALDDCTSASHAIAFIKKCYLPKVTFYVNGEKYKADLKPGELVRSVGEDADIYFDKKERLDYSLMLTRVNGMYMHESWLSSEIKGTVIIELRGRSTELLTSNRDGIGKRELRYAIDDFRNELAANTKSALRKKKNVVRERFHGEGKFSIKPELVTRDILVAMGDLTPKSGGALSSEQQQDVLRVIQSTGAIANEAEGPQIDLRIPRDAISAMMEIAFLGPLHVKTLAKQAAWQPDFFIYNQAQDFKVPSKFRPDKMPPTLRKLARFWAELCRFVLIQLNYEGEYGVGWIFEESTGAAHLHLEDENWLLLNPFIRGKLEGLGGAAGTGEMLSLSNKEHVNWLYAMAVHEATHLVDGISMHDEAFAAALTYNVARTANRGRQVERIRKAVVARGAAPGASTTRINPSGKACPHPHAQQVADPKLWERAEYLGVQPGIDNDPDLELRNCECGSTMSKEISKPKENPPPRGTRYWPESTLDPEDADTGMTFLNALRTAMEVVMATGGPDYVRIMSGRSEPGLYVANVRKHREWPNRVVLEIDLPDDVPEAVWTYAHRRNAWMTPIAAVVATGRAAPGELSRAETERRIEARREALGGSAVAADGWAVFDTETDRGHEIQIDDEFWSGARDDERVADSDVAQLPEAIDALRVANSVDQADTIDGVIRMRTEIINHIAAILDIVPDNVSEDFLLSIMSWLMFDIEFGHPTRGEVAWEVHAEFENDARDEIWTESEELGWIAPARVDQASEDMQYAILSPANTNGDVSDLYNRMHDRPDKFEQFTMSIAHRIATVRFEPGVGTVYWYRSQRIVSRLPVASARTQAATAADPVQQARSVIRNTLMIANDLSDEQNRLAQDMITQVLGYLGGADQVLNMPDIRRRVFEAAQAQMMIARDVDGNPYSLLRPPAYWSFANDSLGGRVPIRYRRPAELEEIEQATATALGLIMTIDRDLQRDFIAAVWEEVLSRRGSGRIPFVYSRVDERAQFNAQILDAARAIARQAPSYWSWEGHSLPCLMSTAPSPVSSGPIAGAVGIPAAERIPEEARGIAELMATPTRGEPEWFQPQAAIGAALMNDNEAYIAEVWRRMLAINARDTWHDMWRFDRAGFTRAVQGVQASMAAQSSTQAGRTTASGSARVPGIMPAGQMRMIMTNGGRGSYPAELLTILSDSRDTSYGNDEADSIEFSIEGRVYRLWISAEHEGDRGDVTARYVIQIVDPPHPGATVDETFDEGQPTGGVILETDEPDELVESIRGLVAIREQRASTQVGSDIAPYFDAYMRVINVLNEMDGIGGPGDTEYIEVMGAIRALARSLAYYPRRVISISSLFDEEYAERMLASYFYEQARMRVLEIWDIASRNGDLDGPAYQATMLRIADEASMRGDTHAQELVGERPVRAASSRPSLHPQRPASLDMSDVRGNVDAVNTAVQAVAERKNLLMTGPSNAKAMIAKRMNQLIPPDGTAPLRAPHHTISVTGLAGSDPRSEVQQARGGILYLEQLEEFLPSAIEALANELRRMPRNERPIVVATSTSGNIPRRIANALDFPLRAAPNVITTQEERRLQAGASSAELRRRIELHPTTLETDDTSARFAQLDIGRSGPAAPLDRSVRLARELTDGTRVHLIKAVIRPPDLYVSRGTGGEVMPGRVSSREISIKMDDGTVVDWKGPDFEQLAEQVEPEPEYAERYRLLEMNPARRRNLKDNPAWVTSLLARHFEEMEGQVPSKWLPKLSKVDSTRGRMSAAMPEYGCGTYGCVLPTLDKKVVLKVTTDTTEAEFATTLANDLPKQVTVTYHYSAKLSEKRRRQDVWLLWRDSADDVGEIDKVAGKTALGARKVELAIDAQHKAAQKAFVAAIKLQDPEGAADMAKRMAQSQRFTAAEMKKVISEDHQKYLDEWEAATIAMGEDVPELRELADGLVHNLRKSGVLFGDIHADNIGRVGKRWLVIDPGHIAVVRDE